MSVGLKLVAFALVLLALFGLGAAVGSAVGPIDTGGDRPPSHELGTHP